MSRDSEITTSPAESGARSTVAFRPSTHWVGGRSGSLRAGVVAILIVMGLIAATPTDKSPLVVAHRGASGYRPEHTLAAYELGINQGADYIEPDLVMTSDRVLVARHENEIGGTTDVASRFPDRRTTKVIDGERVTGFFVEDFTLAEIKQLRARERLAFRSHGYDGKFEIPTFEEILRFVAEKERAIGRRIGLYPETKHPTYHESLGLAISDSVIATLHRFGYTGSDDPIFIQSFEVSNLQRMVSQTRLRLIQLIDDSGGPYDRVAANERRDYESMITADGLRAMSRYTAGIAVAKQLVQPIDASGSLGEPTNLVRAAHEAGLLVHVWTLRADSAYLAKAYRGDAGAEVRRFRDLGVDGLFTDFPDVAKTALDR